MPGELGRYAAQSAMSRKFKPPKLKLSPQQCELMWMLEEAGAEDLRCIVATIKPDDLHEFEGNVRMLLRLGLVHLYRDLGRPDSRYVTLTQSDIDSLPDFEELLNQHDAAPVTGIMLTESGYAALRV